MELVQQGDGAADGGEAAEQGVVDGFVWVVGQAAVTRGQVGGIILKHGFWFSNWVQPSMPLTARGIEGRKART